MLCYSVSANIVAMTPAQPIIGQYFPVYSQSQFLHKLLQNIGPNGPALIALCVITLRVIGDYPIHLPSFARNLCTKSCLLLFSKEVILH